MSSEPVDRRAMLRTGLVTAGLVVAGCSTEPAAPTTDRSPSAPSRDATHPTPTSHEPSGRRPSVEVTHGSRTTAAVALTFHGSGDPALARALLSEAERMGARITVLAVGTWLADHPSVARWVLDGGHDLGNHTYTHPVLSRLDAAGTFREIARCDRVLRRMTGRTPRWFRPSGTQHATPLMLTMAGRVGYARSLSYDVDPRDYQDPGIAAVRDRTLAAVRPGSVVSLHLGHEGTVGALPAILEGLRQRNLRAVTATTLLPSPP